MTIRRRLAISNVLMILVPIVITAAIAACCLLLLWLQISRNTGLGFEDSESFYAACDNLASVAADAVHSKNDDERLESLRAMSSFLDRGAMSLVVTADGEEFYSYGDAAFDDADRQLASTALSLGEESTVSTGGKNLHIKCLTVDGTDYVIYIYNTVSDLSYTSLKVAIIIAGAVLILAIVLSITFTDRFLTRFVLRHIKQPLLLLAGGVHEISEGNLDYRIEYSGKDEFKPVCEDFNGMAQRLKESVEQSQREEESRRELMASVSHDLRSPLTSIQAYVEGLIDGVAATPEAQKRYLETIKRRAEELERMVEKILDYSRLETGAAPRNPELMHLDDFIASELAAVSPDYAERGLIISSELEPFTVRADKGELRQLVMNIADNSLKYKNKDTGKLCVTLKNLDGSCVLSFTDDGPGVPEEALPKLFDVFYRTDPARSDRSKGSGLGLAIVAKTAERMGGGARAENAEGGGLSIIITIPNGGGRNGENTDN